MNLLRRLAILPLLIANYGFFASCSLRAQTLTDLGDFGGGISDALSINDSGEVVGYATLDSGQSNAFLYSGGTLTDIGTLGGSSSVAQSINNSGQIVGYSTAGSGQSHAFLYSSGGMGDLGTFAGGDDSAANGINDSGQIVGRSNTSSGNYNAFSYSGGVMTHVGASGGTIISYATAINNNGQIVGYSNATTGSNMAFVYSGGVMTNLGTLGGASSVALSINSLGQIVGSSDTNFTSGSSMAFLYSGGTMLSLGSLGGGSSSTATAINNEGQIVGTAITSSFQPEAFIYSTSTGMENLNLIYSSLLVSGTGPQAGFTSLNDANGINDSGEIVGTGSYWNGSDYSNQAFLLQPVAVPEPSSWELLFGSCGLFAFLRCRYKKDRQSWSARSQA